MNKQLTKYTVNEERENKYCIDCPSTPENYLCTIDDCPHDVIQLEKR